MVSAADKDAEILEQLEQTMDAVAPADANRRLTQVEADEVLSSEELLASLNNNKDKKASGAEDEGKLPEKWIIASIFIFLIYLIMILFVK